MHASYPTYLILLDHPNNIWSRVQITKLFIMTFSPVTCYFLLLHSLSDELLYCFLHYWVNSCNSNTKSSPALNPTNIQVAPLPDWSRGLPK